MDTTISAPLPYVKFVAFDRVLRVKQTVACSGCDLRVRLRNLFQSCGSVDGLHITQKSVSDLKNVCQNPDEETQIRQISRKMLCRFELVSHSKDHGVAPVYVLKILPNKWTQKDSIKSFALRLDNKVSLSFSRSL